MQRKIEVGNLRDSLNSKVGFTDVRVDRYSVLSNPYELTSEAQRKEVISEYRLWLLRIMLSPRSDEQPTLNYWSVAKKYKHPTINQVKDELERIANIEGDIRLLCWCHPKECHADVLVMYLKWIESKAISHI